MVPPSSSAQVLVSLGLDTLVLALASHLPAGATQLAPALPWLNGASHEALSHLALAALWNGLATCALTTWAMSYAQQSIAPRTAALAYALEPVFAALFAAVVLHESLGPAQWTGGVLIVASNVVAAM